jgi:hypothetical protein
MTMASSLRQYLNFQFETFTIYDRQSVTIKDGTDHSHGPRQHHTFPSRHLNAVDMKNYLVNFHQRKKD